MPASLPQIPGSTHHRTASQPPDRSRRTRTAPGAGTRSRDASATETPMSGGFVHPAHHGVPCGHLTTRGHDVALVHAEVDRRGGAAREAGPPRR